MTFPVKRLYRSRTDRKLLGVCAGLGFYFGVDPVIVRLLWIFGTLVSGLLPGAIVYLAGWFIVPVEPALPGMAPGAVPAAS
jgi:phage shock protein C